MKLSTTVINIFDSIIRVLASGAGVILVFIALAISVNVIRRYLGWGSAIWLLEVTEFSLLWMTLLAAAWVLKQEGHVKMDVLIDRLKLKHRALLNTITSIISAIVCLLIAIYSLSVTVESLQAGYWIDTAMMPPQFPIFIIIPLGFFLLFFQFLRRAMGFRRAE